MYKFKINIDKIVNHLVDSAANKAKISNIHGHHTSKCTYIVQLLWNSDKQVQTSLLDVTEDVHSKH